MTQVLSPQVEMNLIGRKQYVPRRSLFETRMDILRAISEGSAKPTHIMHRSNTCWKILQENLQALKETGLVRQDTGSSDRIEYAVTEKGTEVVGDYLELLGSMEHRTIEAT
jgi:predicted transcriptional regulator